MKRLIALLMALMLLFGSALAAGSDIFKPEPYGPGTENPTLSPYHEIFLDAQWYDTVTEYEDVLLYTLPNDGSARLAYIPFQAFLLTAPYNSDYSYVCYNEFEGFVDASALSKDLPEQSLLPGSHFSMGVGHIANCNEYVSLRKYPNARYDSLCSVPLGAQVDVYTYNDDFYLCAYDGMQGYIKCEYISFASNGNRNSQDPYPITDTYAPTGYLAQFNGMTPAEYSEYIQTMDSNSGRQLNNATMIDGFEIGTFATSYIIDFYHNSLTLEGFFDTLFTDLNSSYSDMNWIEDAISQEVVSNSSTYTFRMVGTELYAWGINYEGGISAFEECYAFEAKKGNATYLLCAYFFMFSEGEEGIGLKCLSQY